MSYLFGWIRRCSESWLHDGRDRRCVRTLLLTLLPVY